MVWKPVSSVFRGGTAAARELKGKRIKATMRLEGNEFSPNGQGETVVIKLNEEGFVGHVPPGMPDMLVLAFPKSSPLPSSLEQLTRGSFKTLLVNAPTFKSRFSIDV